jgi:hypothetical protein
MSVKSSADEPVASRSVTVLFLITSRAAFACIGTLAYPRRRVLRC